jgi:uncharacterized membrane protein
MWIILALVSAVLAATRRTSEKRLTGHLHHFTLAFMTQVLSLPVIGLALLLFGKLLNPWQLGLYFWLPLIITSIGFYPLNAFLYLQAIKHNDLSDVLPIQSLWPVFTLIPAWLTFGEVPSGVAIIGILLTVCGVYALGLKGKALHHPLKPFIEERGSRFMLLAVSLVTIAGILDKIAIQASEAIFYSFASTIGAVLVLAVMVRLQGQGELRKVRFALREVGIIGTLQGTSYTTYLSAISVGPIAYVSSIRSTNVLMGSLLGIVQLKEPFTVAKRVSYGLIAAGSLLLAVGG